MRLLVIEDDPIVGEFLRSSLMSELYLVDVVTDGERGSFLARTTEYDVIILDTSLPKKTGSLVCQEIRKSGKTVPILVISEQAEVRQKVELLNHGADDYLTKPLAFTELLARLRALLRRLPSWQSELLCVADLSLDSSRHLVRRGDQDIRLTKKEFCLLEYLMRHVGQVVSRTMIMDHVWDRNGDPFSNTIETHILNLRRKVDGHRRKKLIYTISGRGYKLIG